MAKKEYKVLHSQNITGAWRTENSSVFLTKAEAQYLIGNAIKLAASVPEPKKTTTTKSKSKG